MSDWKALHASRLRALPQDYLITDCAELHHIEWQVSNVKWMWYGSRQRCRQSCRIYRINFGGPADVVGLNMFNSNILQLTYHRAVMQFIEVIPMLYRVSNKVKVEKLDSQWILTPHLMFFPRWTIFHDKLDQSTVTQQGTVWASYDLTSTASRTRLNYRWLAEYKLAVHAQTNSLCCDNNVEILTGSDVVVRHHDLISLCHCLHHWFVSYLSYTVVVWYLITCDSSSSLLCFTPPPWQRTSTLLLRHPLLSTIRYELFIRIFGG